MQKTVALIIAAKTFRDEEYQIPKNLLEQAGMKVITVSTTLSKAEGKLGLIVDPDILLSELPGEPLDALIFIGGSGSSQYFEDQTAHKLAWDNYNQGKIVGAICIAPVILANAGLLKKHKATVFPDGIERLEAGGGIYTGNIVEVDGRIITGCGPEAAENFGNELVRLLNTV